MTAPIYSVVIYTSPLDVESGFVIPDEQQANRLYATVASISPWPVALYRHDGPKGTCIRRYDGFLVSA